MQVGLFNVSGFKEEYCFPGSFVYDFIKKQDICIICETWLHTGTCFQLDFEGYVCVHQIRPTHKIYGRPNGGISVFVSCKLADYVTILKSSWKFGTIWLSINHEILLNHTQDLIIAACYFADDKSALYKDSFLDPEPFQHLQDEMNYWISHNHKVLAIGDFNARIGSQIDIDGDFLFNLQKFMPLLQEIVSDDHTSLPPRQSKGHSKNNEFGTKLIQLLQTLSLAVFNGRTKGDTEGELTCKSMKNLDSGTCTTGSVIDLAFGSPNLLSSLDLTVLPYCSSIEVNTNHRPIQIVLKMSVNTQVSHKISQCPIAKVNWGSQRRLKRKTVRPDTNQQRHYLWQLQCNFVQSLLNQVDSHVLENTFNTTEAVSLLTETIFYCHKQSLQKHAKDKHGFMIKSTWYDEECKSNKGIFLKIYGDETLTSAQQRKARQAWTAFKKSKKRQYLQSKQMQLMETYFSTSQSQFWRVFQSTQKQLMLEDMDSWSRYFRTLLSTSSSCENTSIDTWEQDIQNNLIAYNLQPSSLGDSLNYPIENDEINEVLHKLSFGKSADMQGLTMECFKLAGFKGRNGQYVNILSPVLKSIFNCALQNSDFPEQWTVNMQCPIFKGKGSSSDMNNYRGIAVGSIIGKIFSLVLDNSVAQGGAGRVAGVSQCVSCARSTCERVGPVVTCLRCCCAAPP